VSQLRAFHEELKNLLFVKERTPATSNLWGGEIPKRLNVYRNNTRTNWMDTLDHDFPLTRKQFSKEEWNGLQRRYFVKHPPSHWELNTSMIPFRKFLESQKVKPYVKELADYEWYDLQVFIDRSIVRRGLGVTPPPDQAHRASHATRSGGGVTNPTAVVRVYQHQIFFWALDGAPAGKPPPQKPEVLVFYRDTKNTCHIEEADPLMLLFMEHFRKPKASLVELEPVRQRMLPTNHVPLDSVYQALQKSELLL
jgi:hypothetical protein